MSMNMGGYGNLRESFDTSQEKRIANPILLIFLSLESRITSIILWKEKGNDGRQKEKKEEKDAFS